MIREAIGVGETEVLALEDAKRQLGIDESEIVEFEVIQRAEKKKFGLFGGAPAKVKITLKAGPAETAEEFLSNVLKNMKLESVSINKKEIENGVEFDLEGENVGFVIGRRGETLDALQYLTSLVVNKGKTNYIRVKLDTEDYRRRRKETLENLARGIAYKVKKTRKPVVLEPMNPYERRIIHSALQGNKYVETVSEGEEPYRHVVVKLKRW